MSKLGKKKKTLAGNEMVCPNAQRQEKERGYRVLKALYYG